MAKGLTQSFRKLKQKKRRRKMQKNSHVYSLKGRWNDSGSWPGHAQPHQYYMVLATVKSLENWTSWQILNSKPCTSTSSYAMVGCGMAVVGVEAIMRRAADGHIGSFILFYCVSPSVKRHLLKIVCSFQERSKNKAHDCSFILLSNFSAPPTGPPTHSLVPSYCFTLKTSRNI